MLVRDRIDALIDPGYACQLHTSKPLSSTPSCAVALICCVVIAPSLRTPFLEFSQLAGYELYGKVSDRLSDGAVSISTCLIVYRAVLV